MNKLKQIVRTFLALTLLSTQVQAQQVAKGVKNIVLVHGLFADGSSWERIIPLLHEKGYNVVAVQNPLTSMEADLETARRAIAAMDGPVLLVGHSYGGMIITQAGIDPKVVGLFYVSALVPDEGQSANDVVKDFPSPGIGEFQQLTPGFLSLSPKGIHEDFAQDLPYETRSTIYSVQVPWAAQASATKVTDIAWKTKPSWFVIARQDRIVLPALQRNEAKMIGATSLELESSHLAMISHAKEVADFIIKAAESLK